MKPLKPLHDANAIFERHQDDFERWRAACGQIRANEYAYPPEGRELALKLHEAGMSSTDIAKALQVHVATAWGWVKTRRPYMARDPRDAARICIRAEYRKTGSVEATAEACGVTTFAVKALVGKPVKRGPVKRRRG